MAAARVVVTGATGMLGRKVVAEARARGMEVVEAGRQGPLALDLADEASIRAALADCGAGLVVNCAAITSVEDCARAPLAAWQVNARSVSILADCCRQQDARLVQVSTDHYFTGDADARHGEDAPVTLFNDYARTKFAAEAFALTNRDALVLRTNILGIRGPGRPPSLVDWAVDVLRRGAPARTFTDSFISGLDVAAMARALFDMVERGAAGLFNLASRDVYSKHDLVHALARRLGLSAAALTAGSVGSLSVRRADSLGLDVRRAEAVLGRPLPGLDEVIQSLALECEP
ncbi:MAG TPA: sugar nucleotide-binding protein [Magnetospirillum sp.]|nr:sugar nucleotide-binding protein [Magnetospirillum sp.]